MSLREEASELARLVERLGPMPRAIANAMRRVPREPFVPLAYRSLTYADEPIPLDRHATLSAPSMVVLQLEWAQLLPGLRVLEIGSGSGYLLALLAELVEPPGKVYGVELDTTLASQARLCLTRLGYADQIQIRSGDGAHGWPEYAPFDRILVSCATPEIRSEWKAQVSEHGTIVAPVGTRTEQELVRWTRQGATGRIETGPGCRFVALRAPRPSDI